MKLICGLGNPGTKYEGTRHNVGFAFLDALAKGEPFKEKWNALLAEIELEGERLLLLKPQTYMNLSGHAVQKFASFYKIPLDSIYLVYDDVDLPLGTIRLKEKGSAGTHNGMKSVIQELGSEDFPRLRLGIESRGQSAPEQMNLSDFVLARFTPEEEPQVKKMIEEGVSLLKNALA